MASQNSRNGMKTSLNTLNKPKRPLIIITPQKNKSIITVSPFQKVNKASFDFENAL